MLSTRFKSRIIIPGCLVVFITAFLIVVIQNSSSDVGVEMVWDDPPDAGDAGYDESSAAPDPTSSDYETSSTAAITSTTRAPTTIRVTTTTTRRRSTKPRNTQHRVKHSKIRVDHISAANNTLLSRRNKLYKAYMKLGLHTALRQKIAKALCKYPSPEYNHNRTEVEVVTFVCHNSVKRKKRATLTLFTTVYNNATKLPVFNNTMNHWTHMMPVLQPVLFVTPNVTLFEENTFYLMERACSLGWDVAIAPNTNDESYPLIRSMFQASYHLYNSKWHGYSNGDILFDQSLFTALDTILNYASLLNNYTLVGGRRYDIEVSTGA